MTRRDGRHGKDGWPYRRLIGRSLSSNATVESGGARNCEGTGGAGGDVQDEQYSVGDTTEDPCVG